MLAPFARVVRGGYEVVWVGRVDVHETLSLVAGRGAHVDHRLQAGQRHQQIDRSRCTLCGDYAFAGTVGHIDAARSPPVSARAGWMWQA